MRPCGSNCASARLLDRSSALAPGGADRQQLYLGWSYLQMSALGQKPPFQSSSAMAACIQDRSLRLALPDIGGRGWFVAASGTKQAERPRMSGRARIA